MVYEFEHQNGDYDQIHKRALCRGIRCTINPAAH